MSLTQNTTDIAIARCHFDAALGLLTTAHAAGGAEQAPACLLLAG